MRDVTIVRRLVEILTAFYIEERPVEEDLAYSLTNEFLQNIQTVLLTKQSVILQRWKNFLHVCGYEMLNAPETYLRYVIYACRLEFKLNFNIFEKFIGVFAVVIYLNLETLKRTEVNFCKLIPEIFMVFFSSDMKKMFRKRGGFHQFAKYINSPNYLSLKSSSKCLPSFCDFAATVDVLPFDLAQQMEKVSLEENSLLTNLTSDVERDWSSLTLVQNILNSTKNELPLLPRDSDLNIKLHDFTHEEISQIEETNEALEALDKVLEGNSNSDSETSDVIEQMADKPLYEDFIEAVIRYNLSNSSSYEKVNNRLENEAYVILEHLKDNIEYFIKVLDNYD